MKRIVSLILAVMLCASLAAPAMAAGTSFTDVPSSHWACADIRSAAGKGVITGYADGTFKPAGTVTNAQFLTMIARAFYADKLANNELRVSDGDEYYLPALYTLVPLGILDDTSFGNTYIEDWIGKASAVKNINRYDMAQVMYNVMTDNGFSVSSGEQSTAKASISDWNSVPSQYQTAVASCYALGLLGGYSDGQYKGTQTMNRAQAATVIERLYKVLNGESTGVTTAKPAETPAPPLTPAQAAGIFESAETETIDRTKPAETVTPNKPLGGSTSKEHVLTNGKPITEENVKELMDQLRYVEFPARGTNPSDQVSTRAYMDVYHTYYSDAIPPIAGGGQAGCNGWACWASDYIFGKYSNNKAWEQTDHTNIRCGDIIVYYNLDGSMSHAAIATDHIDPNVGPGNGSVSLAHSSLPAGHRVSYEDISWGYSVFSNETFAHNGDLIWVVWTRYPD